MEGNLSAKVSNRAGLAALMVVGIHTARSMGKPLNSISEESVFWWFEAFGHWGVFSVAVPFFFVCSGFFLAKHFYEDGWWQRECAKRVHSLLVPYVVWSSFFALLPFVILFFKNLLHGRVALLALELNCRFLIHTFGLSPFRYPGFPLLWYLRTLFLFVIVSPVLKWCINRLGGGFIVLIYVAALAVGVGMLAPNSLIMVFFYCFQMEGLFYFCLGLWLRIKGNRECGMYVPFARRNIRWLGFGAGLLLIIASTLLTRMTGRSFYTLARVLFTPPLLLSFWLFPLPRSLPICLTSNTFALFLVHGVVLRGVELIYPQPTETIPQWLVKWAIAVTVSILVALLLRLLSPGVARVLFGGR